MLDLCQYITWAGTSLIAYSDCDLLIPYTIVFSGLRVFALTGRQWIVSGLVFLLAFVPFAINCVSNVDLRGCKIFETLLVGISIHTLR